MIRQQLTSCRPATNGRHRLSKSTSCPPNRCRKFQLIA